jgi:predicted metalloprotease
VPPPLVSPEAVEDLDRIAGVADTLAAQAPAPADGSGVTYLGTKNVETVGGYMDRVLDNLDFFWQSAFQRSGAGCAFVPPERRWIAGTTRTPGSCARLVDELTGAYYCTSGSATDREGSITVGVRWMFDQIYASHGDHATFAVAAVLAHEMGHHVQDLLGIMRDSSPHRCCGLTSLNTELQADCLGGVWAYSLYGRSEIDLSSMEEAVRAAADAGDSPDSHPADRHGTPDQRKQWFTIGFDAGAVSACDGALALR